MYQVAFAGPEDRLTLSQAAQRLPHRPDASTVWRWCRKGIRTRGGAVIRLGHVRYGGRIFTTPADLEQFGKAVAEADIEQFSIEAETPPPPVRPRRPSRRDRDIANAAAALRARGVLRSVE